MKLHAQGVQRTPLNQDYNSKSYLRSRKQTKNRSADTHTRKWVSPPIMITIIKGSIICFQPQKR